MSKTKENYHSFKDFAIHFKDVNQERIEKQTLLAKYGVNIPFKNIDDVEIIEQKEYQIIFRNKIKKETYKIDLMAYIFRKWKDGLNVTSETILEEEKELVIEKFYKFELSSKPIEIVASEARQKEENLLFSRMYANVSTKYGDFCIQLEDNKANDWEFGFGPYISFMLYHGQYQELLQNNDNDFDRNQEFLKYSSQSDGLNLWTMGGRDFKYLVRNIWNYSHPKNRKREEQTSPIYGFENSYRDLGLFFINGKYNLLEYARYGPHNFNAENIFEEFEFIDCNSKMYFRSYLASAVFIKKEDKIEFYYNNRTKENNYEWGENVLLDTLSSTPGIFTFADIDLIIKRMESLITTVVDNELKMSIIKELSTYKNLHCPKDINLISQDFSLENQNFENIVMFFKQQDLNQYVEELIEFVSKKYNISIEDILGMQSTNLGSRVKELKKEKF